MTLLTLYIAYKALLAPGDINCGQKSSRFLKDTGRGVAKSWMYEIVSNPFLATQTHGMQSDDEGSRSTGQNPEAVRQSVLLDQYPCLFRKLGQNCGPASFQNCVLAFFSRDGRDCVGPTGARASTWTSSTTCGATRRPSASGRSSTTSATSSTRRSSRTRRTECGHSRCQKSHEARPCTGEEQRFSAPNPRCDKPLPRSSSQDTAVKRASSK